MLRVRALAIHQPQPLLLGCESPRVEAPQHPTSFKLPMRRNCHLPAQTDLARVCLQATTVGAPYSGPHDSPARPGSGAVIGQIVEQRDSGFRCLLSDTTTQAPQLVYDWLRGLIGLAGSTSGRINFGGLCPSN